MGRRTDRGDQTVTRITTKDVRLQCRENETDSDVGRQRNAEIMRDMERDTGRDRDGYAEIQRQTMALNSLT